MQECDDQCIYVCVLCDMAIKGEDISDDEYFITPSDRESLFIKMICNDCLAALRKKLVFDGLSFAQRLVQVEKTIAANAIGLQNVYDEFKKADAGVVLADVVKLTKKIDKLEASLNFIKSRLKNECLDSYGWVELDKVKPPINKTILVRNEDDIYIHKFTSVHRPYSFVYHIKDKAILLTHWAYIPDL
jgi:hypothetical protein